MRFLQKLRARALAVFRRVRVFRRLGDLEKVLSIMRACPHCGTVLVVGHERVHLIETASGTLAVCQWGRGELERKVQIAQFKHKRKGA